MVGCRWVGEWGVSGGGVCVCVCVCAHARVYHYQFTESLSP